MNRGRFKPISFEQVLASTKFMLGLEGGSEWDAYLYLLIEEGAKHLLHNDQYLVVCKDIEIIDGRACLPNGFKTLLAVELVSEEGELFENIYQNKVYAANAGIIIRGGIDNKYLSVSPVQGGHIVFNDPQNIPVDKCRVWYISRNVDKDGLTVIHEMEERAIRAYACYQFAMKYPQQYKSQFQFWREEWINQKKWLNAQANVEFWRENKERISTLFNAFLVFKTAGQS